MGALYERYLAEQRAREPGLLTPGNVDLRNRPHARNPDGSVSTVRSMSIGEDGREVLIPTVSDDGRIMDDSAAVENYRRTGKNLGSFRDVAAADSYAERLHEQQARMLEGDTTDVAPAAGAGGSLYDQYLAERDSVERDATRTALGNVSIPAKLGYDALDYGGKIARGLARPITNFFRPTEEEVAAYERGDYNPAVEGFAGKLGINIHNPTARQREFILPEGEKGQTRGELAQSALEAAALVVAPAAEAKVAGSLIARGAPKLAAHVAGSAAANAGFGALASPGHRLEGAAVGGTVGAAFPVVPAAFGAAARRVGGVFDFTGGLDDALAAGVREGADPAFSPFAVASENADRAARRQSFQELLAGMEQLQGRRAGEAAATERFGAEAPSATSQLLRGARGEQLEAQARDANSLHLPARELAEPELRDRRSLSEILEDFQRGEVRPAPIDWTKNDWRKMGTRELGKYHASYGRRLARGEEIADDVIDRELPTLTKYDSPAVKRARAEQAAMPSTRDLPETAPVAASDYDDELRELDAKASSGDEDAAGLAERIRSFLPQLSNVRTRGELRGAIADYLYGNGAARKERQAFIVIGPPAAGKSTIVEGRGGFAGIAPDQGALILDSDHAKELLPEFRGGRFSGAVHPESGVIKATVFNRALSAGDNIALPTVGEDPEKLRATIRMLHDEGYAVHLVLNELPVEKTADRAMQRWVSSGRFVDPHYIVNEVGDRPLATYEALKADPEISTHWRYSNDVERGQPPQRIEAGGPGLASDAGSPSEVRRATDSLPAGDGTGGPGQHEQGPAGPSAPREPPGRSSGEVTPPPPEGGTTGPSSPSGHIGTTLLSSLAGAGTGGLVGATQGDTPEERARNAALGAAAGFAGGAALAEGAALSLRVSASENAVRAAVRGAPTREEVGELLTQVRANPRKSVHYVVRNDAGKVVGSGNNLAEFFADVERSRAAARAGAAGVQPDAGSGSPLRPNTPRSRIPYTPAKGTTPPPVPNGGAPPPPADLDPDDYFNLSTVLLDPGGEKRLRDEVALVAHARGLHPKQRVSWEETKKVAQSIGLSPEDLVAKGDVQRLTGAEMLAIRNIVKDNVDALERISQQLGSNASLTSAEREMLERQSSALERQTDVLLGKFVKARSQTGRDLNNLKILAEGSLDPVTWNVRAKRMLGDEPFTDEHRAEIMRLINAGDRAGLATYVAKLRKPTRGEKLITLWKAGLLTGPPTHIANALGNTTMSALEVAKDIPAAGLDALFGAVTGQRTKNLSLAGAARASLRGAKQGAREAADIMRGRSVGEGLSRYDLSREIDYDNVFLDKYTKTVFRSLTAADRVFKRAALERSIAEQARVVAKASGFNGAAFRQEVERLTQFPTDEMALQAVHDAEIATFQNRGVLGQAAQGLRRPLGPVGDVILPFTMTPANVASRVVEYSPLGALASIPDVVKLFGRAMSDAERASVQKRLVERLGRSAVGSLPILAGAMLAKAGKMTGGFPQEQAERDRWQLEGKQENAVLVNGKWHSLERVSPLGNLMVFGASLYNALADDEKSVAEKAGTAGGSLARTVADQSFLTGLSGALDAVMDPKREGGAYLRRTAGSVVPNVVNRVAKAVDPTVREKKTVGDELRSRIPGLSSALPAKVDQFGHELESPSGLAAIFDPTSARTDRTEESPLIAELARVGAHVGKIGRQRGEDDASYRKRQKVYGQVLENVLGAVVASEQYQRTRQLAEILVARDQRFQGRDPRDVAAELQRGIIEDAVSDTRRKLTLAIRKGR